MVSNLHFASPWAFALFLLLPLMLFYRRRHRPAALYLPTLQWLKPHASQRPRITAAVLTSLRFAALSLMIIALARPQSGTTEIERLTEGVDIVLTLDTSGSMQAMDFVSGDKRQDRLTIVKQVAADFIKGREADRIGIVVFGESAFTQCPPTLDHRILQRFMDWIFIGMAGRGTALGSAIAVASKRLESSTSQSKVMILLTDGKNTAGDIEPQRAAEMAKALGIKIYTIGVGSDEPVPFPVEGFFGTRMVNRRLELDEELLKEIAFTTGGLYFHATDTESLRKIYTQIDALERTEIKFKEHHQYTDLFATLLMPALLLMACVMVTESTALRRIP